MLLNILHRTTYRYARPARDSFNEARLRPHDDAWQRCAHYSITSKPVANTHHYTDLYGNQVDVLQLAEAHTELVIEARSCVETLPHAAPMPEDAVGLLSHDIAYHMHDFLMDTPHVPLSPELWRCALDIRPHGLSDLWVDACALSDWVYENFEYVPGSTQPSTTANEALAKRQGVCQDYAHVMLGLCRSLKMPARYVSGYFFNNHFDPNTTGAEASHAWVDVYLPSQGWCGLDPTHQRPVDERYVRIAVGRDYHDIRPLSGAYRGAPERSLDVYVRITQQAA